MAKISARGATEVARLRVRNAHDHEYLYAMCSDGRVLTRPAGDAGTGYSVRGRVKTAANRTAMTLAKIAARDGMAKAS